MRILLADDDPVSQRLLSSHLGRWGYAVEIAADGEAALEALLSDDGPSLAILDWVMPKRDGISVCREVRARASAQASSRYPYLILVTSKNEKREVIAGLEAGADDYLTKPVSLPELRSRLHVGRRILSLHAQLLETQEILRVQATRDALTGFYNRRGILELLERELARGRRLSMPTAIALCDVDHFKPINDNHGHAAGDAVLREVAQRLGGSVREYDAVGRYGGEEFLLVLPQCALVDAIAVAERVRGAVCERPMAVAGTAVEVTLSVGVALCAGASEAIGDDLARVDAALYVAKRNGRNRVEVAASEGAAAERGSS